ncbi:DgyrCDS9459 [Dimorphilus gyrociliatus]|uniref:Dipeptidyl peptidase 3 n=1 Tax=Dimorphilus gyrociliatus TaxID=2664684 RepID=A0A7I8VYQ3_9ANNE|nr:DgyrCDS9459 [Dimorphilus gyrociliatus]
MKTPVAILDCSEAFGKLTKEEKLYAHYLAQAGHYGSLVCLYQTSLESPGIFLLLLKIFQTESVNSLAQKVLDSGLSEIDYEHFLAYTACIFCNMGNYKSFGDTKIIPAIGFSEFEKIVKLSKAYEKETSITNEIWSNVKDHICSLTDKNQQLGFGDQGITTYYSQNCDAKDAEILQEFLETKKISPYNTRVVKNKDGSYDIRIASVNESQSELMEFTTKSNQKINIRIVQGDYCDILKKTCNFLELARQTNFANEREKVMLRHYINSFKTGSIDEHKEGSKIWVLNKSPIIETYIGFIESYRDPFGVRAEFEGFAAIVNKALSEKFQNLVAAAEKQFVPLLPWPNTFERENFVTPDFTSLDVLAFGSSGIPAGINIPNYEDVKQEHGFKNVSLGNVLTAAYSESNVPFLGPEDNTLLCKYRIPAFELQVGLHELLGHGSGLLFKENPVGKFNFDRDSTINPLTGKLVDKWYKGNESYDSKFQDISSSYEECRAECVGMFLCFIPEILEIFGFKGEEAGNIIYVNWLNELHAGLRGLEFYTPANRKWRQAHMQARYVILRHLMDYCEDLVKVEMCENEGVFDLHLSLNRDLMMQIGKEAIGQLLLQLQIHRSTGDVEEGRKLYEGLSRVEGMKYDFLKWREIVLAKKKPRHLMLQCHTSIDKQGDVELKSYEKNYAGRLNYFEAENKEKVTNKIVLFFKYLISGLLEVIFIENRMAYGGSEKIVCRLDVKDDMEKLSESEQLYVYKLMKICDMGSLISMYQSSNASFLLFWRIIHMLENNRMFDVRSAAYRGIVSNEEYEEFLDFASSFMSNYGTYDYFEQANFYLPFDLAFSVFENIYSMTMNISPSDLLASDPAWKNLTGAYIDLFSWTTEDMKIISPDCTLKDIMDVNEFLEAKGKTSLNTRMEKHLTIDNCYDVHIGQTEDVPCRPIEYQTRTGKRIIVRPLYDSYFQILNEIVHQLEGILLMSSAPKDMIKAYLKYFKKGSASEHQKARKLAYESKIIFSTGFIERHWDRTRSRGLFRTFIGIRSDRWGTRMDSLTKRVGYLSNLIPNCNIDYNLNLNEKGTEIIFVRLLRYGPGIPYYTIEDAYPKAEGLKKIFFENVIDLTYRHIELSRAVFRFDEDEDDLFEIGSLYCHKVDMVLRSVVGEWTAGEIIERRGKFYFISGDRRIHLPSELVDEWYEPPNSFRRKFGDKAVLVETFRRQCLSIFLTTADDIMDIFDIGEDYELEDIQWVMLMNAVLNGVEGLTLYIDKAKAWCYSHCLARFLFLSYAMSLENSPFDFDTDKTSGDLYIKCDRKKMAPFINTNVKNILETLHRCRLNGDFEGAMKLIGPLTEVSKNFLDIQKAVRSLGRKQEVIYQETPYLKKKKVKFTRHENTRAGVVETVCDNYWKNHEYITKQVLFSFTNPP